MGWEHTHTCVSSSGTTGLDWGHTQTPVTRVLDGVWMAQEVTQHQKLLDLPQKRENPFMGSINYTSQEVSTE